MPILAAVLSHGGYCSEIRSQIAAESLSLTQTEMGCCSVCEENGIKVFILAFYVDSFSVLVNGVVIFSLAVLTVTFVVVNLCNY